jgi:hypothetical protein
MTLDPSATIGASVGVKIDSNLNLIADIDGKNYVAKYVDMDLDDDQDDDGDGDPNDGDPGDEPDLYPAETPTPVIIPTVDKVIISENMTLGGAVQGDLNKVFAILKLKSETHTAIWQGLRIDKTGTLEDQWIDAVNVWYYVSGSTNPSGPVINTSTDTPTGLKDERITIGSDIFTSSTVYMAFPEEKYEELDTTYKTYLVTMDINPFAPEGDTIGLTIDATGYFSLEAPDFVDATNLPVNMPEKTISPYKDTVFLEPSDVTNLIADNQINQADQNLPIMRMRMQTDLSYAWWKDGASQPAFTLFQMGSATDAEIIAVKLWYDANNDGDLQTDLDQVVSGYPVGSTNTFVGGACELSISTANAQQILPGVAGRKNFFITLDIYDSATPGHTIILEIRETSNIFLEAPDIMGADNIPFQTNEHSIIASPRVLEVNPDDRAPVQEYQGTENVEMAALRLRATGYQIDWTKLLMYRTGTSIDEDVEAVKIYKDVTSTGTFEPQQDVLVASGAFTSGSLYLNFTTQYGTQTVTTTPEYWFIVYDIAPDAEPGATIGISIGHESYFNVVVPHSVDGGGQLPFQTTEVQVMATVDVMNVAPAGAAPGSVIQGDKNIHMMSLHMEANQNSVIWTGIDIHRNGPGTDNDVSAVKIYRESNGMPGIQTVSPDGIIDADELTNYGTEVFINGTCNVVFDEAKYQTIPTAPGEDYYVLVDVANMSAVGTDRLGIMLNDSTDIKILGLDDSVNMGAFPTELMDIEEYPDKVTITGIRKTDGQPYTPETSIQGQRDVEIERLRMTTRTNTNADPESEADMTQMRITLTGEALPEDIAAVKVYYDADRDSVLNPDKDTLISSGNDVFGSSDRSVNIVFAQAQVIRPAEKTFFIAYDFSASAEPLRTAGAIFNTGSFIKIELPNIVMSYVDIDGDGVQDAGVENDIFPIESGYTTIETMKMDLDTIDDAPAGARQGDIGVSMCKFVINVSSITAEGAGGQPTLNYIRAIRQGTGTDSDIKAVSIYKDIDGDGELDPDNDMLVSSGIDQFTSGTAQVTLSTNNVITEYEQTYFLAVDVHDSAKIGNFVGIKLETNENFIINITPLNRQLIPLEVDTPYFESSYMLIRHRYAPSTPKVNVNQWINSATTVQGSWESYTSAAKGITNSLYWAGDGAASISSQQDAGGGTQGEATIPGLSLQHGQIYKFNVQTIATDINDNTHMSYVGSGDFRVDLNRPTSPGAPISDQQRQGEVKVSYNVNWTPAYDNVSNVESGVAQYEVQERKDTSPVWKTVKTVGGDENNVFFSNKPSGHFYYYRVRAQDNAGNWGEWSEISEAAATGLPSKVLSEVSNYPNPARFDKGDEKTMITYILREPADVEIFLYDMMGYLVREWNFKKDDTGGKMGSNSFPWFGDNEIGAGVAKGGYILRIRVKSSEGTVEETRKIAIIK